jgi:hypothetical protein
MKKLRRASPVRSKGTRSKICIIKKCEEFTLYSDGRVVASPEVENALLKATFRISDAGGGTQKKQDRLNLANALLCLAEFTASLQVTPEKPEAASLKLAASSHVLELMSSTLGSLCLRILQASPEVAEEVADDLAASVKLAARSIAKWKNSPPDNRSSGPERGMVWLVQIVAKTIFRETRERPRWSEIEDEVWGGPIMKPEADPAAKDAVVFWSHHGKDAARRREIRVAAGLENLPD